MIRPLYASTETRIVALAMHVNGIEWEEVKRGREHR